MGFTEDRSKTRFPMTDWKVIKTMIKEDLEKRKDKAMIRSDTDDLWTRIETLQWVLFVIFAIRNGQMVVI
jgi:hypothetical protein